MRIETTILNNLLQNEEYVRKVIPFIEAEYFTDFIEKTIFTTINEYIKKYNDPPVVEALLIDVQKVALTEEQYGQVKEYIDTHIKKTEVDLEWVINETEKWCKDKAIYNAIFTGIQIIDGKSKDQTPEAIPKILQDALGVSFDSHIGHDYIEQSTDRYEFYHTVEEKVPFDLDFFNKITKGGMPNKTLNICLAGTGVGKSLFMCHVAASTLMQGKNVLYITLEMADKKIAERIDANLMNISLDDLESLPKKMFDDKIKRIEKKTKGKLIVKEYPTASAHTGHFRALLNELIIKKNFRPDILLIDYLNICSSSRFKMGASIKSYSYIKSIAEELRGLAVEFNIPIMSATQTTRSGFVSTDIGLEDTSESFG
ncbi:MAG: DnaB-like helicase C-terminal domain-containing protein, partial [Candidatus Pacebacteria bacterium]|nr:DnaB-like helicase C-terminal domain-containing protein [Candidatus Paceibacterota bacterium]